MEENRDLNEEIIDETEGRAESAEEVTEEVNEAENNEENDLALVKKLKEENDKLSKEVEAFKDRLLRITAEYENFRKRTAKEKEGIYADACVDVLKEVIPTVDNLERALAVDGSVEDLKKGIEMTIKGFQTSLEKLGVEEISVEEGFDPNMHQAVMHIQDENYDKNVVAEVFLKGYKKGDKVIRYSMVKVAN
ncbi:protein GrpE [Clostridium sp. CAG:221]|uniref:nucleotide exchange factor GrpE n=1 Tax=Clostridium sp. CAG:221 TaxID=1262780 RepID=UPI00033C7BC3|nr:nucleotide exchange factor GrpE [Clostridium sp. CAG:221]CDB15658.1 protein GrpE [Clostridium sp. CAG:221]